jgi:hypothetical protein
MGLGSALCAAVKPPWSGMANRSGRAVRERRLPLLPFGPSRLGKMFVMHSSDPAVIMDPFARKTRMFLGSQGVRPH